MEKIKGFEIANSDTVLRNYVYQELEQPDQDGLGYDNKVISTLLFYSPQVKG